MERAIRAGISPSGQGASGCSPPGVSRPRTEVTRLKNVGRGSGIHQVNNLKLLDLMGISRPESPAPYLPAPPVEKPAPGSFLLHPGCDPRNSYKRWPAGKFSELARRLLISGRRVSVILGPGEEDLSRFFTGLEKNDNFNLYSRTSLTGTMEIINNHESFVNTDSRASGLRGRPWEKDRNNIGPADPKKWRCYSNRAVTVMRAGQAPMHAVRSAQAADTAKANRCLADIEVDDVLGVFKELAEYLNIKKRRMRVDR